MTKKKLEKKFSDFKVMKYLKVKVLKFLKKFFGLFDLGRT